MRPIKPFLCLPDRCLFALSVALEDREVEVAVVVELGGGYVLS